MASNENICIKCDSLVISSSRETGYWIKRSHSWDAFSNLHKIPSYNDCVKHAYWWKWNLHSRHILCLWCDDECTAHFRQLFWWIRSCYSLKLQKRRFLWMHSSTWFCQYVMKLGFLMYLPSEWLTTRGRCVIYNQVQLTDVSMWSREWEGVMDCESSTGSLKLLLHYLMRGNAEPFMTGIDILPADQGINDPHDALENLKWQKK